MKGLLFLSRVAFLCNLFFLLAVSMHWYTIMEDPAAVSTVIIIGYVLAVFVFNPIVNILYLAIWGLRRRLFDVVPRWLVIVNFFFLLLQLFYLIFVFHDTQHS